VTVVPDVTTAVSPTVFVVHAGRLDELVVWICTV
jgi:hypothetical protein